MFHFRDPSYLKSGNTRQQEAWRTLEQLAVWTSLAAFDPVLVGTIPIHIDIETSDLDVICCWADKKAFIDTLVTCFGQQQRFQLDECLIRDRETVVAGFFTGTFDIEIFGQNIPVTDQAAYRHMLIEAQILREKGETFRQQIVALKRHGLKTEPAFAQLLGLHTGDPFEALLHYQPL